MRENYRSAMESMILSVEDKSYTVRPRLTFFLGPKKNRVNQNRVNRG